MADGVFTLAVVTPEERLVDTPARSVVFRSSDGDLTVLDGHTPLVTDVVPGEVKVEPEEGDPLRLAVHGGFLQVETGPGLEPEDREGEGGAPAPSPSARSTRVTLLAGVAELADQIDVARAERAREDATTRVDELRAATGRSGAPTEAAEAPATPEELELTRAEAALHRAELRLSVAGASSGAP
jgi:F-type H+-transporting ATPase subunit epsilon